MLPKYAIYEKLLHAQVVAVIRGQNSQEALEVSKAAISGGISAIELTYTTPEVEDVFKELRHQDILLGARFCNGYRNSETRHFIRRLIYRQLSFCKRDSISMQPVQRTVSSGMHERV